MYSLSFIADFQYPGCYPMLPALGLNPFLFGALPAWLDSVYHHTGVGYPTAGHHAAAIGDYFNTAIGVNAADMHPAPKLPPENVRSAIPDLALSEEVNRMNAARLGKTADMLPNTDSLVHAINKGESSLQ